MKYYNLLMVDKNKIYKDVAKLHIKCIKKGFLPTLGVRFLALMYKCIDQSDFSILIVDFKDNQLVGFVSGTSGKKSLYKKMLRYPLSLFFALCSANLNFNKIKKIINILLHSKSIDRSKYPKAELLTICVNPDFQRQGIANKLYADLSSYFKENSISKFVIIVGEFLEANKFYVKNGAVVVGNIHVHKESMSNVYLQEIC